MLLDSKKDQILERCNRTLELIRGDLVVSLSVGLPGSLAGALASLTFLVPLENVSSALQFATLSIQKLQARSECGSCFSSLPKSPGKPCGERR